MKLGPVTKLHKRKKKTSKKFGNDVMSANCDVIVIFSIYDQFGAIQNPDFRRIVCKLTFSSTVTFYLTKSESRTKKILTKLSH